MVESEQGVHLTHDFHNLCMSVSNRSALVREPSLPGTNLEELVNCLRDTFAVNSRVWQVDQDLWWVYLGRLELAGLALLGHLGRLLCVLRVDRLPLLHPVVGGLGCVDDLFPGNVFFLAGSQELEELDLLLRIELSPKGAGSDEL